MDDGVLRQEMQVCRMSAVSHHQLTWVLLTLPMCCRPTMLLYLVIFSPSVHAITAG